MSNHNLDVNEEIQLTQYLISHIRDKATGRGEQECLYNYPRDIYFIGNLRPYRDEEDDPIPAPANIRELRNKLAPVAFGAEFQLIPESSPVTVSIEVNWACYYRIFPTFKQQCEHQYRDIGEATGNQDNRESGSNQSTNRDDSVSQENEDNDAIGEFEDDEASAEVDSPEVTDSPLDRKQTRNPQDSLFIRFRKVPCHAVGALELTRNQDGAWQIDDSNLQAALNNEVERAGQIAVQDPERLRTTANVNSKIRVPNSALDSEDSYNQFVGSFSNEVNIDWRLTLNSQLRRIRSDSDEYVLALEFVNNSQMPENTPNIEAFLFDTNAKFVFENNVVKPFEVDLAPHGFRYDKHVWGRGVNCAVEHNCDEISNTIFETTHIPIYQQKRFVTRSTPAARFSDLANDPIPTLNTILQEMENYREVWEEKRQQYMSDSKWNERYSAEFEHDFQRYNDEIENFRRGYELVRDNLDILLAFKLTNETFSRGSKTEWRLFQIVFLVSQIPGIFALANPNTPVSVDRERVDIIYFPTGGGKTEAYLATIVFHCFFDRLRGKSAGVTAWTRFPLRLLTLQQTQRVADVIGIAELIRQEQTDLRLSGPDVDGFAVGYFVGQGGSPNDIVNPQQYRWASANDQVTWSRVNDTVARQDWKRVAHCPSCRTANVTVEFDENSMRLYHQCNEHNCRFPNGIIPVYIVDNEIYRYLPSVIVGTIDKLAGLGNQRKFGLLLGQVDGRCLHHGYYKGSCCQKDCTDRQQLQQNIPHGLSGPTLFIQDELHLLKEGLGTFDAHYETFTQRLLQEYGQTQPLKIIASSATIEAFERQVNHLYGRTCDQAQIFPGSGPTLIESFYAHTLVQPQRLYVGLIPHNKTIFNAILELIELYHRSIQNLQQLPANTTNPYHGTLIPGTSEWQELLDYYATSLTYFSAGRELNSIRTDLVGDVIPHLQKDGMQPLHISELTGDTPTDEVSRILEKLERPAPLNSNPDSVLATSMVSHGVDIDRFNAMIFYGMPRQNAEYIQSSSRVGRSHVGIVFTCLHPVRERDQSHYSYFIKFHEFLGQLVEPVAINRWSKFSINRTLPGLFMGVLLQLIANRSGERNPGRYSTLEFVRGKISDGSITPEHFIPLLEEAYGVQTPTTEGEVGFRDEIHLRVRQYLDWILSPSAGRSFVSDVLIPKPMRSLRDVDEIIPIELDSLGTQWTNRTG